MDAIFFSGAHAVSIGTDSSQNISGEFPFSLSLPVAGGQEFVSFLFPAELVSGVPDLATLPDGEANLAGDVFVVVADGSTIVADPVGVTALQGATENASFQINANDRLNGVVSIDYRNSVLATGIHSVVG